MENESGRISLIQTNRESKVMKTTCRLMKWGAITAMGLTMLSLPVRGADESIRTKTDSDYKSSTDMQSGKMLGHIKHANKLIGKEVLSSDSQKLGKIDDVVVDLHSGRILYAIIGSGGVLGAGEKLFAVPPGAFSAIQGQSLSLKVDKSKFAGAPQLTSEMDKDSELGKTSFVNQLYQHFGLNADTASASSGGYQN